MAQELRAVFLKEFVRTVVKQMPLKQEFQPSNLLISLPQRSTLPIIKLPVSPGNKSSLVNMPMQKRIMLVPPAKPQLLPGTRFQPQTAGRKPEVLVKAPPAQPNEGPPFPKTGTKIMPLLRDPSVVGIECPGPGKSVMVNQAGSIRPSQTTLTAEEIKAILTEVSSETKIPLIEGVFKAAYKIFMVTAVVSEFVGSRFIIEKRPRVPEMPINPSH